MRLARLARLAWLARKWNIDTPTITPHTKDQCTVKNLVDICYFHCAVSARPGISDKDKVVSESDVSISGSRSFHCFVLLLTTVS